jgi:hypothetical protein
VGFSSSNMLGYSLGKHSDSKKINTNRISDFYFSESLPNTACAAAVNPCGIPCLSSYGNTSQTTGVKQGQSSTRCDADFYLFAAPPGKQARPVRISYCSVDLFIDSL